MGKAVLFLQIQLDCMLSLVSAPQLVPKVVVEKGRNELVLTSKNLYNSMKKMVVFTHKPYNTELHFLNSEVEILKVVILMSEVI